MADEKISAMAATAAALVAQKIAIADPADPSKSYSVTLEQIRTLFAATLSVAANISIADAGLYFESANVEGALQKNGFLLADITDDVALNKFSVTDAVAASAWVVTIEQDDGLDLEFNIDKTHLSHTSDTMTVDATAFAGTDATPKTVYVYVYNNVGVATLVASNTSPEGVIEHVDVARYKAGTVGATSLTKYGAFGTVMGTYEIISKVYHRFFGDGTRYNSGMSTTCTQTNVTIGTGSLTTLFDTITTTEKVVGTDGFFHVKNDGTYEEKTDFSFTNYSTGEAISANKFYNVVLGIVEGSTLGPSDTTRIMAIVQRGDTIPSGKEYESVNKALGDEYGVIITQPTDELLKGLFIPICRVIIKNDANDYLWEIPESGTGLYCTDLRGNTGSSGGGTVLASNTPDGTADNDSVYWNATTGTYDKKTLVEAQAILDLVDKTNTQSIGGEKTFTIFPISPSSAPDANYEFANKKYVDDNEPVAGDFDHDDLANLTGTAAQYNHPTDANMTVLNDTSNTNTGDETPAATVTTQAFGDAGTVGTDTDYAREDHKHAMPAAPVTTINANGETALTGAVTITGGTNITLTQTSQDISIASTGGSGLSWSIVDADTTAVSGHGYLVNSTEGRTIDLPASPSIGDTVAITDMAGNANTHNIVIDPGTEKIQGSTFIRVIAKDDYSVVLVYTNSTVGWAVYSATVDNMLGFGTILHASTNYHWEMFSTPTAADGNRSTYIRNSAQAGLTAGYWFNGTVWHADNAYVPIHNLVIDGVSRSSATGTNAGGGHSIGTTAGSVIQGAGASFGSGTGGSVDSFAVTLNDTVEGTGGTNVQIAIKTGLTMSSGDVIAVSEKINFTAATTYNFTSFVTP